MLIDPGNVGLALDGQIVLRWRFLFPAFFWPVGKGLASKEIFRLARQLQSATTVIPGQALLEPGDELDGMARSIEAVIASAAKQSISPRKETMDCFVARAPRNDGEHEFPFSRRDAPEVCKSFLHLSKKRGRRECRMHAAPAVSCAMCTKRCAHEHTGQRRRSDIPCAMALRLIARSPR